MMEEPKKGQENTGNEMMDYGSEDDELDLLLIDALGRVEQDTKEQVSKIVKNEDQEMDITMG